MIAAFVCLTGLLVYESVVGEIDVHISTTEIHMIQTVIHIALLSLLLLINSRELQ